MAEKKKNEKIEDVSDAGNVAGKESRFAKGTRKPMKEDAGTEGASGTSAESPEDCGTDVANGGIAQSEPVEIAEDSDTRYMRLAADFQNFKKRTEKEKSDIYAYANEKFASDLLEVIDNFERAIAQDAAEGVDKKFIEGMGLIMDQLVNVLSRNDIEEIDALGEEFDPNLHHAVQMVSSEEYASNRVSTVIQKGYRMKDRVIRPSMVVVAQ